MEEKNMKEKKENTPCVEEKLKEAEKEEIAVPDSDKKHPNDRKDSPISQMEGKAKADYMPSAENCEIEERTGKKGIFSIFENRRSRSRKLREEYSVTMHQEMSGYAVQKMWHMIQKTMAGLYLWKTNRTVWRRYMACILRKADCWQV